MKKDENLDNKLIMWLSGICAQITRFDKCHLTNVI